MHICYILSTPKQMEESFGQVFIDLIFLIICLRVIYISISQGILRESFKIIGLFFGAFFAFQYYLSLSESIGKKIPFLSPEYFLFLSFLLVLLGVGLVFAFAGLIAVSLFGKKKTSLKEKLLSFFLGAFRASFLVSVIIFLLHLSPLDSKHFCHTIAYSITKNIGPKIYLMSFKMYNKFNPKAALNKEVEEYYEANKSLSGSGK